MSPLLLGSTDHEFDRFVAAQRPVDDPREHAVGIAWVIDTVERQVLLVRHRVHGWSCAGGHLETGENPAEAAARELAEETGIIATPLRHEPVAIVRRVGCPRAPDDGTVVHWGFGYRFEVSCSQTLVTEAGQPGRWFPLDALPRHRPRDIDDVLGHLGLTV